MGESVPYVLERLHLTPDKKRTSSPMRRTCSPGTCRRPDPDL